MYLKTRSLTYSKRRFRSLHERNLLYILFHFSYCLSAFVFLEKKQCRAVRQSLILKALSNQKLTTVLHRQDSLLHIFGSSWLKAIRVLIPQAKFQKTKVTTQNIDKGHRQPSEPIKTQSKNV